MWIIWLICAIVCGAVELLTQWVWTLCLSAGCVLALVACVAGASLPVQLIMLAVGSLIMFFLAHRYMNRQRIGGMQVQEMSSNMDAIIGRTGIVTEEIRPGMLGRVKIDGDNWQARARHESDNFQKGEQVKVLSYDSIIITVTKFQS